MNVRVVCIWLFFYCSTLLHGQGDFSMFTLNERDYWVYTPSTYTGEIAIPLVVALHGCSQSATTFAVDTELNDYAEQRNFIVVYPEQPVSSNSNNCWNWFLEDHQFRAAGEPQFNMAIINQVISEKNIANDRIFALGMSAGAAEAVIMGVTYPDLLAAISVSAGLEYMGGATAAEAVGSQVTGIAPDPDVQGERAYQEMQKSTPRPMKVIVFHGSMDATVQTDNSAAIIEQWAQTNDLVTDGVDNDVITSIPSSTETGQVPNGRTFTRTLYTDESEAIIMEKYIIDGMTHRYSGGPANAPGGSIYTDPTGPKATKLSLDFFGITNNDALAVQPDFTFNARIEDQEITLHWKVSNFDASTVLIERATQQNDFQTLDVVSVNHQQIKFIDKDFRHQERLYYRLQWLDRHGVEHFSPIVVVEAASTIIDMQVAPNPTKEWLNWRYFLPENSEVILHLYDVNGSLVRTLIAGHQQSGLHENSYNISDLPVGVYQAQFISRNKSKTIGIQVLH